MINPRISADWSTTKPIASFSCTPSVQEVHTKAEVVQLTPGLLGLGVIFSCHALECVAKHIINLQIGVRSSRLQHSLVHQVHKKYIPKLSVIQLTPGLLGLGVIFSCQA